MNKKQLIKIIELVVRKEVKKQVNEIFIKENKIIQNLLSELTLIYLTTQELGRKLLILIN